MSKEKLGFIGIGVIVIGLLMVSIFINPEQKREEINTDNTEDIVQKASKESEQITDKEKKDFIEINVDTYLDYYKESEKKIVLMARPTCQYCQIAEPILQKIAKDYQLDIYYLNTDEVVDEADQERLLNSNELFQANFGTPFLVIVQNEKIVNYVSGLTDTNHYLQTFKDSEII